MWGKVSILWCDVDVETECTRSGRVSISDKLHNNKKTASSESPASASPSMVHMSSSHSNAGSGNINSHTKRMINVGFFSREFLLKLLPHLVHKKYSKDRKHFLLGRFRSSVCLYCLLQHQIGRFEHQGWGFKPLSLSLVLILKRYVNIFPPWVFWGLVGLLFVFALQCNEVEFFKMYLKKLCIIFLAFKSSSSLQTRRSQSPNV